MSWRKVTFPFSEAGTGGKVRDFEDAFLHLFMARGAPKDAAIFSERDADFTNLYIYLSPEAARIATELLAIYRGEECPAPTLRDSVHLSVGHDGARQALLRRLDED